MITRAVGERQAVWLIGAVALIARLAALWQPMRYDESVTWAYFVGRSWTTIVSDYRFPNNHVFFSLLAKASSSLAPFEPWALRLPAFVAGVAIVPLTWAVGRRFAGSGTGLLGAALTAGSTTLILYSTNARGYSLVVALFLVLLLLADELRTSRRAAAWSAFVLLAALGLYAIPVMLYPLAVVCTWLLLAAWGARGGDGRGLAARAVLAGVAAGALALMLYLPIVRAAGIGALAGNRFVAPSTWGAFASELPTHAATTLLTWTSPLPWWAAPVLLIAALIGARHEPESHRPSLALAMTIGCGALLVATHRVPFVRVWLFVLPLFLLAVARGVLRIARRARADGWKAVPPAAVATAAAVAAMALLGDTVRSSDDTGAFRAGPDVTAVLSRELRPGDRVLAPIPANGPLLYYFGASGLDTALLNTPPAQTRRAFLVLDPSRGRTLDWAVSVGMIDPTLFGEPHLLMRREGVELWRSERR